MESMQAGYIFLAADAICWYLLVLFSAGELFEQNEDTDGKEKAAFTGVCALASFLFESSSFAVTGEVLRIGGAFLVCYLFYESGIFRALCLALVFGGADAALKTLISGMLSGIPAAAGICSDAILLAALLPGLALFRKGRSGIKLRDAAVFLPLETVGMCICLSALRSCGQSPTPFWLVWFPVFTAAGSVCILFYVSGIRRGEEKSREAALAGRQAQLQEDYYRKFREYQEETRSLWHDIEKYVLAMNAEGGRDSTAAAQAEQALRSIRPAVDVGNTAVSAILDYYVSKAEDLGIRTELDVSIPEKLDVSSADLAIVIGNTFDNAIDACRDLPEEKRIIHVLLQKVKSMLCFSISNPYTEENRQHSDGRPHGYGLRNVKTIVSKTGGNIAVSRQDHVFHVSIRLNCRDQA